jgi:hypothetical protein
LVFLLRGRKGYIVYVKKKNFIIGAIRVVL